MMTDIIIRNLLSTNVDPATSAEDNQPVVSDYDLNDGGNSGLALTPAAVLIPLIERPQGLSVILIQRTEHLHNHAGQISFPGGKTEPDDEGPVATALREAWEEIGLSQKFIKVMGSLDDYETVTGFRITPVVTMVTEGFNLVLDPYEVSEVFEVPLDFIFDPENHQICNRKVNGIERHYYVFEYENRYIWGATAGMLMNLYQRVTKSGGQDPDEVSTS